MTVPILVCTFTKGRFVLLRCPIGIEQTMSRIKMFNPSQVNHALLFFFPTALGAGRMSGKVSLIQLILQHELSGNCRYTN
jgi:hypothetical protein